MPYKVLNLQMYADGEAAGADAGSIGDAAATAENPVSDGVATEGMEEQAAPAAVDQTGEESWDSLIKGKYKKEYQQSLRDHLNKRLKNQQDQSSMIKAVDPILRGLAQRYNIQSNPDGSIPIDKLSDAVLFDDQALQQEAYDKGMSVDMLRQMKKLEMENNQLKGLEERQRQQEEWRQLNQEAEGLKELYPSFNLEGEMENPEFISLLATLRNSGFPNAVRRAFEVIHNDELISGSMQYATQRTKQMVANSIKSGMNRPKESAAGGTTQAAGGMQGIDPSKLTDEQMDDIIRRAARGERITFA